MPLLEAVIGWLAPPQCLSCDAEGSMVCESCLSSAILPYGERCWGCGSMSENSRTCQRCRRPGSPAHVWITTSHEGLARELLHAYKFEQQRAAASSLAKLMTTTFTGNDKHQDYLVIPLPTATKRVRERGFDHASLLARIIAQKLELEFRPVLRRLGQTRQVGSTRTNRLAQMADEFWVKNPEVVTGRRILLVDDVITTGATIYSASKTMRLAGAVRVDALVFAKHL